MLDKFDFSRILQTFSSYHTRLVENSQTWFTEICPAIIAFTTFIFFIIAVVFGIIFASYVVNSQPQAWDNWIQKAFKITATVCKFFVLFILLANAFYIVKFLHMINNNLEGTGANNNLKNVSFPILLIIGVILFIPSSINLLLLYILYGYIKAVSILRSTGSDNQTYSNTLSLIESITSYVVIGVLIISIIFVIELRKRQKITYPLVVMIASLIYLFFVAIIDNLIDRLIISPISKIHNRNIDNENDCNNVVIDQSDYIGCIIITIVIVLFYFIFIFLYGLGAVHPSIIATREKFYSTLCNSVVRLIQEKIITQGESIEEAKLLRELDGNTSASFALSPPPYGARPRANKMPAVI